MAGVVLHEVLLDYGGQFRAAAAMLDRRVSSPATRRAAVVGPNGSGKSTLLKALAGLMSPRTGQITFDGLGQRDVAYLAQEDGDADRTFPMHHRRSGRSGPSLSRRGLFGGIGAADQHRLDDAFARVGLDGLQGRPINALSGGQFQRALFARVIAQDARIILLDEPFAMLDARTAEDLETLVEQWTSAGRVVVIVLHDFELVRRLCPQTLILAGEVRWRGDQPMQVLTPAKPRAPAPIAEFAPWRRGARRVMEGLAIHLSAAAGAGSLNAIAAGALALAFGGAPLGVLLVARRMSLSGDALSHGVLLGAAAAYLIAGPDPWVLTAAALIAAFVVTALASLLARTRRLPEDGAFAVVYLTALAGAVALMSRRGGADQLETMLFGGAGAIDRATVLLAASAATATLIGLALFMRGFVAESLDPALARVAGIRGGGLHILLMMLVALGSRPRWRGFARCRGL